VLTDQQLRTGGPANPWETAWMVWDYTDNDHFYYFALKTNGWELGKRDPSYPGGQRFLATGSDVSFALKTWYGFSLTQAGSTMTISVDGRQIVNFTDQERPYSGGRVGIYTEDARVYLDNVAGAVSDNFEAYPQVSLQDGSSLGSTWAVPFLGYGTGGVTELDIPPVTAAAVLSLPTSAAPTTSVLGGSKGDRLTGTTAANLIDGKGGADTMSGGAGDDTYLVDNAKDSVVENVGQGVDTVRTALKAYTLPGNVENLVLTGASGQSGVGNALNNMITSNGVGATLNGGGGDDVLVSNGGRDVLTGGTGRDVFQFASAPSTVARITDFTVGQDVLDLRALLTGYTGPAPVIDGWVSFAKDGAGGTIVYVDADGPTAPHPLLAIADLVGVSTPLSMQSDWIFR
jgi:Ca2+-binding RTX toxin-like protein